MPVMEVSPAQTPFASIRDVSHMILYLPDEDRGQLQKSLLHGDVRDVNGHRSDSYRSRH